MGLASDAVAHNEHLHGAHPFVGERFVPGFDLDDALLRVEQEDRDDLLLVYSCQSARDADIRELVACAVDRQFSAVHAHAQIVVRRADDLER